jgi:hypothetical protein
MSRFLPDTLKGIDCLASLVRSKSNRPAATTFKLTATKIRPLADLRAAAVTFEIAAAGGFASFAG